MTNREWLNSLDDEVRNRMTANDNKNTTTELTDEDYFKALREKPLQKIDRIPSADVVEVVRCKDCIHWLKDNNPSNKPEYRLCEYYRGYKNQDGFCDFGERKKPNDRA